MSRDRQDLRDCGEDAQDHSDDDTEEDGCSLSDSDSDPGGHQGVGGGANSQRDGKVEFKDPSTQEKLRLLRKNLKYSYRICRQRQSQLRRLQQQPQQLNKDVLPPLTSIPSRITRSQLKRIRNVQNRFYFITCLLQQLIPELMVSEYVDMTTQPSGPLSC